MVGIYQRKDNNLISKDISYTLKKDNVSIVQKELKIKKEGFVYILIDEKNLTSWLIKPKSNSAKIYDDLKEGLFQLKGLTTKAKNLNILFQNNDRVIIYK